ncbi:hypothetical protein [Janibacter sp. GS2]|uniref:hypothetical protein n=1 Tax=Janibacter sp. GS2 TaxID=3442646 RepID=UPI003EBBF47F
MTWYLMLGVLGLPVLALAAIIARRGGRMDGFDDGGRGVGVSLHHTPDSAHNVTSGTRWGGTLGAATWGGADMGGDWSGRAVGHLHPRAQQHRS